MHAKKWLMMMVVPVVLIGLLFLVGCDDDPQHTPPPDQGLPPAESFDFEMQDDQLPPPDMPEQDDLPEF